MIKIQGQYTLEDYKNAQKLHLQSGRFGTIQISSTNLILVLLGFTILLAGSLILMEGAAWIYLLPLVFILVFFISFQFYGRPRQIARIFQQQKELSAPFEIELSEDGFGFTGKYSTGRIPWMDFAKWKEDQALILLYRSDVMFNMLPKRFLAGGEQLEYVHQLLAQNNVPDARKIRSGRWAWRALIYVLLFIAIVAMVYFNVRQGP